MNDKATVLLVDDDPGLLEIFKDSLEDFSFNVLTATNGLEAKDVMERVHVDCLITDITMPEMNGIELVTHIRKQGLETPVFFITGYMDYSREVLNIFKPKAVIFKPFDVEEAALLIKNHFLRGV